MWRSILANAAAAGLKDELHAAVLRNHYYMYQLISEYENMPRGQKRKQPEQ
jgi:hypothetical protein